MVGAARANASYLSGSPHNNKSRAVTQKPKECGCSLPAESVGADATRRGIKREEG